MRKHKKTESAGCSAVGVFRIRAVLRGRDDVCAVEVRKTLAAMLANYYRKQDIAILESGLWVEGDLRSFQEHAPTAATVVIQPDGNTIRIEIYGRCEYELLGAGSIVITSLLTCGLGFLLWMYELFQFLAYRRYPEQYFQEAIGRLCDKLDLSLISLKVER